MNLEDFEKLGFKANKDKKGKNIFYHPEGVTYTLTFDKGQLETTSCYVGCLWCSFDYPHDNKLVSRECTLEKIEKAKKWKSKKERVFLD